MYKSKLNKESLSNNLNTRLSNRNDILLSSVNNDELQDNFNYSNIKIKKKKSYSPDNNEGEITGFKLNINDFESHLPMRSGYSYNKEIIDQNSYLDFDLFEKDKNIKKVNYNDPNNGTYSLLESSNTSILKQSDSIYIYLNNISNINIYLFNNIRIKSQDSYNINGLGLYIAFSNLFIGSGGNTEIELKQYFKFINIEMMNKILKKFIKEYHNNLYPHIIYNNYILNDKNVRISSEFKNSSKYLSSFIQINKENNINESSRINLIINSDIGCKQLVSSNTIKNIEIGILNVITINPKWAIKTDKIVISDFMGLETPFLKFNNNLYGVYEDNDNLLIEIPCKDRKLSFGIIYNKSNSLNIHSQDKLESYISKLELTRIKILLIPKIMKRHKTRLNSLLYNTNLKTIFIDTDLPDIYPENDGRLNNIIQYCDLILSENDSNDNYTNYNKVSIIQKIIINTSFIYYMRYIPTNTILSIGTIH